MLPLRTTFSALALVLAASAAHAETWASGGSSGAATNHDIASGLPMESTQLGYEGTTGAVSAAGARAGGGNSGSASGSYSASAGVLKATAAAQAIAFADDSGFVHVGGAAMTTEVQFLDYVTIDLDGFYQFSWLVNGSASTTGGGYHGDGRFGVQKAADYRTVGVIDFAVMTDGSPSQGAHSFLTYLTQGTVLSLYARMSVTALAGNQGAGSTVIDYGHSAYAVIETLYGPGAFHSESGYAYAVPSAVPEPATLALTLAGLAVLGGTARRARSAG